MKGFVVELPFGVLCLDEGKKVVSSRLFPKEAEKTALILWRIRNGEPVDELISLIKEASEKGVKEFVFEDVNLAESVSTRLGVSVDVVKPNPVASYARENAESLALELGFSKDPEGYRSFVHQVGIELSRIGTRLEIGMRDSLVIQVVGMMEDLDRTINLLSTRMRELYAVHFPELSKLVPKHEMYLRIIQKLGTRDAMTVENLKELGIPEKIARRIEEASKKSVGAELTEEDLAIIQSMARKTLSLMEERAKIHAYLDELMKEVAPNLRELVGASIGAKLIAYAGGLRKLATLPSSTVQLLGAEKALFRHLRKGTKPPKHGVIFQHPLIHRSPRKLRGRIARALAGKLAIAARADAFTRVFIGDKLKKDLEARVREIRRELS